MATKNKPNANLEDNDQDAVTQVVTFDVCKEIFAFNMQSVIEIIRVPQTVSVPLTPATLIGLANLRGGVLPIIDLRMVLGFTCNSFDDQTRVIVLDSGNNTSVGFVVDKVSQVKTVDEKDIDNNAQVEGANKDIICGIIKSGKGQPLVQMLDASKTLDLEFSMILAKHVDSMTNQETVVYEEDEQVDNQLVSFVVSDQEYAFNLLNVEEIVRVPEHISQIPKVDSHILGLIELRGRLLPLICMRGMMEMPTQAFDDSTRVIIINLKDIQGKSVYAGFVVDQMREVLRVADSELEVLPELMKGPNDNHIVNICQLEEGKRIVSILSAEDLFGHPSLLEATTEQYDQENTMQTDQDIDQSDDTEDDTTEQLVVFNLEGQEYAISIAHVQEITRIPDKLDKVPKTQSFVEGLVNLRGTVLPVLDMRSRFHLDRMDKNDRQRIVVLSHNNIRTGFIVDAVQQVLRLPKEKIEQSPNLSDEQTRVMGKVVNLKEGNRIIQVLDVSELLSDNEIAALAPKVA